MSEINTDTKICKKCGRKLPLKNFRLTTGQFYNPYYRSECKECEYKYQRAYLKEKNKIAFSEHLEHLIEIKYKEIKPERILDISNMDIIPLGTDEIFVKLMDYKDAWISNYGRAIRYFHGKYELVKGDCDDNGALRYALRKNEFFGGKWIYKPSTLRAARAVVEEFIVNPDKENNVFIWHSGFDKQDCYYRNLYPLNQEQYRIVKKHFRETGDDSELFIMDVINETKYKPDDWSKRSMKPTMCAVGYRGSENVDCKSEAYIKWHDMINRCYNKKILEKYPQYQGCTVCEEWKNFSNFKVWYESHKYGDVVLDLDKDILFKGNKIYDPAHVALVPHAINGLFVNNKGARGDFPLGVCFEKDRGKYRAYMSFAGKQIKLGTFETAEDAFARYKEYKEDFIKDMAEQYKDKIPDKVYQAMLNWKVEITD